MTQSLPQILIIAAEASSELYAFRVMEEFKRRGAEVHFFGIGSRRMEEAGFEILERAENVAVVGLFEVFAHAKVILRAFKKLVAQARLRKPVAVLLLDFPDFNLRLARKLAPLGTPLFYYISPQLWAWRKGRVKIIRETIRRMLVVFPFEQAFYEEHQVPTTFVGHPLLDEIGSPQERLKNRDADRARYGVEPGRYLLGLLPGSRLGELKYNLPTQMAAAEILAKRHPDMRFCLLVAPSLDVEFVRAQLPRHDLNLVLIKDEPLKVMSLCDALVVTSGTATLLAGLAEKPMVIMYRVSKMTFHVGSLLVRNVKYFGLPNLILDEQVVPELLQDQASAESIAEHISKYKSDPQLSEQTRQKLSQLKTRLGSAGAASRVVDALWEVLRNGR